MWVGKNWGLEVLRCGGIVSLWLASCGCHVLVPPPLAVAWRVARNVKDKRFISCCCWVGGRSRNSFHPHWHTLKKKEVDSETIKVSATVDRFYYDCSSNFLLDVIVSTSFTIFSFPVRHPRLLRFWWQHASPERRLHNGVAAETLDKLLPGSPPSAAAATAASLATAATPTAAQSVGEMQRRWIDIFYKRWALELAEFVPLVSVCKLYVPLENHHRKTINFRIRAEKQWVVLLLCCQNTIENISIVFYF